MSKEILGQMEKDIMNVALTLNRKDRAVRVKVHIDQALSKWWNSLSEERKKALEYFIEGAMNDEVKKRSGRYCNWNSFEVVVVPISLQKNVTKEYGIAVLNSEDDVWVGCSSFQQDDSFNCTAVVIVE